jgi:predicted lipoprotein with Yx(FWY)xxD motif
MARLPRFVAVAGAAAVLAACGGSNAKPSITGSLNPTTTAATTTTTPPNTVAGSTVKISTTQFGNVLADANELTLYVSTGDAPDKSNCTGSCLQLWVRYTPSTVLAGPGVDPARLGTIDVDGVKQVTVDHRPLYRFAADSRPGDVRGQGVDRMWWVVTPQGTIVGG